MPTHFPTNTKYILNILNNIDTDSKIIKDYYMKKTNKMYNKINNSI